MSVFTDIDSALDRLTVKAELIASENARLTRELAEARELLALHDRFHGKVGCPGDDCYVCEKQEEFDLANAARTAQEVKE